jgi:signal transduction histidine kinase
MTLLSSLRSRIFLTSALLAVLSIGVAVYVVSVRVASEAENALQREVLATGAVVEQLGTSRAENFTMMARLIADAPKLKAAVDTNDPPTVQDIASEYQSQLHSNLLLVTHRSGQVLATVGLSPRAAADLVATQRAVDDAASGHERFSLLPQPDGMLQLITVPIFVGLTEPDILGTLSVGFLFDQALAAQLKEITGSDIAFGMDGEILATTLPARDRPALAELLRRAEASPTVTLRTEEYVTLPVPLASEPSAGGAGRRPIALILRSRTEQLRFLREIHTELAITAVVAMVLAMLLSFTVARTITRPLAAITDVMREVAATGDLTRKIALRRGRRWEDEDARLLAATFNTLTDSIARFQREMSQKERLSSLGRLSMVIAHEVRNPLMIIKAALHTLRQPDVAPTALREAAADIDEEVARLNRIVNEVLDFARPIQFELAPTDLNALCRESAAAAQATPGAPVQLDLDPSLPAVTTDAERLRIALVNLIVNARQAVEAPEATTLRAFDPSTGSGSSRAKPGDDRLRVAQGSPGEASGESPVFNVATVAEPRVFLSTRSVDGRTSIVIADTGAGINRSDLPRVFDPYFTTKRGGTGLGLPIAKNIVEGLGGTIAVASAPGRGTEIRIELPPGPLAGAGGDRIGDDTGPVSS